MSGDWRLEVIWNIMVWALLIVYVAAAVAAVLFVLVWIAAGMWWLWERYGIGGDDE